MRKRFVDDMDRIARGEDPKGIVRDPLRTCASKCRSSIATTTPKDCRSMRCSRSGFDPHKGYPFQIGQPEPVRRAYMEAMASIRTQSSKPAPVFSQRREPKPAAASGLAGDAFEAHEQAA